MNSNNRIAATLYPLGTLHKGDDDDDDDNNNNNNKGNLNFTLYQATKAQRGNRGIALLFHLPRR